LALATALYAHAGYLGKSWILGIRSMKLEGARVGTRVRVQLDYGEPSLHGAFGTIQKRYGVPEYTAFEVLFPDGRTKLFWEHQLEEAREPSLHRKRWWVFW
jgi:hypothetical protein